MKIQIKGLKKNKAIIGVCIMKNRTRTDKENYKEKVEFEVLPDYFKHSIGTHTYNFKNGIMVTDFSSIKNK